MSLPPPYAEVAAATKGFLPVDEGDALHEAALGAGARHLAGGRHVLREVDACTSGAAARAVGAPRW